MKGWNSSGIWEQPEGIKILFRMILRVKSGNVCCHSVQNLLSSSLIPNNIKIKICRTIVLLVVSYGCETWSLELTEERTKRVFENRELRRIFEPKRDVVTGSGENYTTRGLLICTPYQILFGDQIDKNENGGACSMYGEGRGAYGVLVGKPEGMRPLGRPRRSWEDNIKMNLQEIRREGMDWIDVAQYRNRWRALGNTVMNLRVA